MPWRWSSRSGVLGASVDVWRGRQIGCHVVTSGGCVRLVSSRRRCTTAVGSAGSCREVAMWGVGVGSSRGVGAAGCGVVSCLLCRAALAVWLRRRRCVVMWRAGRCLCSRCCPARAGFLGSQANLRLGGPLLRGGPPRRVLCVGLLFDM